MRILAVTNMYPIPTRLSFGTFVEQQVKGLREIGLEVDVMFLDRLEKGRGVYLGLGRKIDAQIKRLQPDIVHVMYGGVMADLVTKRVRHRPKVVTFHGSDLLGHPYLGSIKKMIASYGVWASWRAARRTDGIVVVSKLLQGALPTNIDASKVRMIPCGIDLERFQPLDRDTCRYELGWRHDRFHVLFPSHRGNLVKRYDLACAAVKVLRDFGIPVEMHEMQRSEERRVGKECRL